MGLFGNRRFGLIGRLCALCLLLALVAWPAVSSAQTPPPEKRTLYLIGTHTAIFNFPLLAYVIVDQGIYLADSWNARSHDTGPGGLAVDETNENLFVSYEGFNGVEVFDARDATPLGTIILVGTSNLAGMVVHQDRGELYVVDRWQKDIFVYDTSTFQQLDHWILPTGGGAWGIDLMGDSLFVTDATNTIRWYNIDTQLEEGSITISQPAVGIAVTDYPEPMTYTSAFIGANSSVLTQTILGSGVQNVVSLGTEGRGVSLNPATDLAYVSAGNKLHTVDTITMTIIGTEQLSVLWSTCDVLASFIPFGGTVKKTSPSHPNGKIYKGDMVTFTVGIQNRHNLPIREMDIKDTYDNTQLSFVSSDIPTDDNNDDGVLDWTNIIATVGADLDIGQWLEIEVVFQAIEECDDELIGENLAQMLNVKDTESTTLPDASGLMEYVINCKCRTNFDCDDGVFCNGSEICQDDGSCESPGNPCPLDDHLWCNGDETEICDEELDECEHENLPCEDDGQWCNGTKVCNEDTDACIDNGPPCTDDGQFCNGDESCDEDAEQCTHSGDPCTGNEECNESNDACQSTGLDDDDSPDDDDEVDLWPDGKVTGGCCGCSE